MVAALSTMGLTSGGDEDENLAEDSAVGKPWVIVIDQWSDASERLVSWILEWSSDAWCLMC